MRALTRLRSVRATALAGLLLATLDGENSFVTRLTGAAEQAKRRANHRTLLRVP